MRQVLVSGYEVTNNFIFGYMSSRVITFGDTGRGVGGRGVDRRGYGRDTAGIDSPAGDVGIRMMVSRSPGKT